MDKSKRTLLKKTFSVLLFSPAVAASGQSNQSPKTVALQTSAVAGLQYYGIHELWPHIQQGQSVQLHREATNAHDKRAVYITWQGQKIGYIPRRDNVAISQLMDKGTGLKALIINKAKDGDWKTLNIQVQMEVA